MAWRAQSGAVLQRRWGRKQNIAVVIVSLLTSVHFAYADLCQAQITETFPGYGIMSRSDFEPDIRKNLDSNPALILGKFNQGKFEGFSTMIRGTPKYRYEDSGRSYDFKLVVCLGLGGGRCKCESLVTDVTVSQEFHCLAKRPPGEINGETYGRNDLNVKTDSEKVWVSGTGEIHYVYQPCGSFLHCATAD